MADPLRTVVRRADLEAKPDNADDVLPGRTLPPSGPADPKQRVGNGLRRPEPYVDLRRSPNLTGFYFEDKGRYRFLVNHAGPHLEALLTLVTVDHRYHEVAKSPAKDKRIPIDWGVCDGQLKGGKTRPIAFRIAGDHSFDGTYRLYVPSWIGEYDRGKYQERSEVGYLEVTGDDAVRLTLTEAFRGRWPEHGSLAESTATRVDRSPVLLDRYMAHASVPWEVRTRVWFPSTPVQRRAMPSMAWRMLLHTVAVDEHMRPSKGGKEMTLHQLLAESRRLGTDMLENIRRNNIADCVNLLVKDVFERPAATPVTAGGFGASHADEMRKLVYRVLNGAYVMASDGYPRENMATVLQRMLDQVESGSTDLRAIEKYLGVGARGARHHILNVKFTAFKIAEIDKKFEKLEKQTRDKFEKVWKQAKQGRLQRYMKFLPVSKYVGVLSVEYKPPYGQFPPVPAWTAEYGMFLGGFDVSATAGGKPDLEIEGVGLCFSASPPRPQQLVGTVGYFRGDVFAGLPGGQIDFQLGGGKAGLLMYGDGSPGAGMHLLIDGELADSNTGAGAGIDSTLGVAWLLSATGGGDIEWIPDEAPPIDFSDYWAKHIGELAVFFPINGARLPIPTAREEDLMREYGRLSVRQALEAFAACELPVLMHPMATIRLEGHADRPDDEIRNSDLSKNRATSVGFYLEGLLGRELATRVRIVGLGEPKESDGDEFDQNYRRVDIRVDLRGPSSSGGSEPPPVGAVQLELRQSSLK